MPDEGLGAGALGNCSVGAYGSKNTAVQDMAACSNNVNCKVPDDGFGSLSRTNTTTISNFHLLLRCNVF